MTVMGEILGLEMAYFNYFMPQMLIFLKAVERQADVEVTPHPDLHRVSQCVES